jgi:hypothetical protein
MADDNEPVAMEKLADQAEPQPMSTMIYTATYSPEDNKLRLSASSRLDDETYSRVKAAGFRWAPKQEIFVAPMWTPERAALCEELAGEIGDEDTSLVERAEIRADRFDDYSDKRAKDSERAREQVNRIADGIPMGQPILVGHHSERHARKDAQRIENGMRKSVKMWETSKYWTSRAAGALRHAKYKELPAVRARRIKGLIADERKLQETVKENTAFVAAWRQVNTRDKGLAVASVCYLSQCFPLTEYPRDPPASQYEGHMSMGSAMEGGVISWELAQALSINRLERSNVSASQWLAHIANRLTYERAMLDEQGATNLLAKKPKSAKAQMPLCNYQVPNGLDIENMYHRGEMIHYPQLAMTQADYAKIHKDYKGTRAVGNSHRVRTAMQGGALVCVYLTDVKTHEPPEVIDRVAPVRDAEYRVVTPGRISDGAAIVATLADERVAADHDLDDEQEEQRGVVR